MKIKRSGFTKEQKANAREINGGLVRILLAHADGKRSVEYYGPATRDQMRAAQSLITDIASGHNVCDTALHK